jgi:hypothetical protein
LITPIINQLTLRQDVNKTFLLTAEKPAKYRIGPYWIQLIIKGEMVADASDVVVNSYR